MKKNSWKIIFFLTTLSSAYFYSQNLGKANQFLDQRIAENKINADTSFYALEGKKFYFFKKDDTKKIDYRKIITFLDNKNIQLVEVEEKLSNSEITSHIYQGDYIRRKSFISIYANKENEKKIAIPIYQDIVLQKKDGIWYLINITNKEEWMEGTSPEKKH